jgi:hypothetical protein
MSLPLSHACNCLKYAESLLPGFNSRDLFEKMKSGSGNDQNEHSFVIQTRWQNFQPSIREYAKTLCVVAHLGDEPNRIHVIPEPAA